MKKITIILMLLLLVSTVSFGYSTDYDHEITIHIEDENGRLLDLDEMKFTYMSGDSRISGGVRGKGRIGGYGLRTMLDVEYDTTSFTLLSNEQSDIELILYDEYNGFSYHLVETINYDDFKDLETFEVTYKLKDMNKVVIQTAMDNELIENYGLYLFNTSNPGSPNTDDARISKFDMTKDKPLFLSKGYYSPIVCTKEGTILTLFGDKSFSSESGNVHISGESNDLISSKLTIPSAYSEYTHLMLSKTTKKGEYFQFWTSRNEKEYTFRVDEEAFESYGRLYLSNEGENVYNKSLSVPFDEKITLSPTYYYSAFDFELWTHVNKINVDTEIEDYNGNTLTPMNIEHPKDVTFDIYERDTMKLLDTIRFSSYWAYFETDLDQSKTYLVKAYSEIDKRVDAISNFELTYVDGLPSMKFINIQNDSTAEDVKLTPKFIDDHYVVYLAIRNDGVFSKTYSIEKITDTTETLDTLRISSKDYKNKEYIITREELAENPNMKFRVKADGIMIKETSFASLMANDIDGHWANEVINKLLLSNKIFNRTGQSYRPNDYITRAEFAAYLMLALELNNGEIETEFTDVDEDHMLFNFVKKASSNGLISGYPDGTFKPNNFIRRQDVATVVRKGFDKKNYDLTALSMSDTFLDSNDIDSYANEGVDFCLSNEIFSGKPGNLFDPKANLTRAEAAVIINKIIELLK